MRDAAELLEQSFLVHNMCRLPGADGTWMVAKGGMGAVAQAFATAAKASGAQIITNAQVERIVTAGGRATGVVLRDGRELSASTVVVNADPFRPRELVGEGALAPTLNTKLDDFKRTGTTTKINMALRALPTFSCLREDRGQHNGTMHLLPQGANPIAQIKAGFD